MFQKYFQHIIVKVGRSKYQKLFKTLIRNIFQDIPCRAHKTAALTPIQHTVRGELTIVVYGTPSIKDAGLTPHCVAEQTETCLIP